MAAFQAGFNAKARLQNTAFAIQTYTCREVCPRQDVSNTEGAAGNTAGPTQTGVEAYIGGLAHMEATIRSATFDTQSNPFAAPFSLVARSYISFKLYPAGVGGVSWSASSFYVETLEMTGDVRTLQPFNMSGYSDSSYSTPAT